MSISDFPFSSLIILASTLFPIVFDNLENMALATKLEITPPTNDMAISRIIDP